MEKVLNNVNLTKINEFQERAKKNKNELRKQIKIEGEWILDQSKGYQFRSELVYEKGKQVIEIDSPTWLGGQGNRAGPMAFCLVGSASCFLSTFATIAAMKGVEFKKLSIRANCNLNFSKTLDLGDEPIIEEVIFEIKAEAINASKEELKELLEMAKQRCPAIYSLTNVIRVSTILS